MAMLLKGAQAAAAMNEKTAARVARLEAAEGEICLRADTGRNNRASIAAHLSAGFRLAPEAPEHPGRVNFIYQTR